MTCNATAAWFLRAVVSVQNNIHRGDNRVLFQMQKKRRKNIKRLSFTTPLWKLDLFRRERERKS